MKQAKTILGTCLIAMLLVITRTEAASVQYALDQSNTLEDDIDYLLVTISDDQPGQLDFLVEIQSILSESRVQNPGIASFGFNLAPGTELSGDDFLLPENWKVQFNKSFAEAGSFDVRLLGTGQTRQNPLQFSILGLGLEDIIPGFASHTVGFQSGDERVASAFFYGDRLVTAVPVPAAVWLFGSGVLLLGRIATRRRA